MYKPGCGKLKLTVLILLMFVSIACQPAAGSTPRGRVKIEMSLNQLKWKLAGASHYRFRLFRGCICEDNEDVLIEVENGQTLSLEYPSGKTMNPGDRAYFEGWGTMELLFSTVKTEVNGDALEVRVTYDPTYGFPVEIYSDPTEITDDELMLYISDFEVLP